ncbi:large conductance mechanosensitive channel protein MscL [Corynebacterium sp. TAE3-ERU30]|uniref:large conductance mechanosensitive channel protein MscL n=1 Tax=Corynebacterium sp. TAE3-ERU30 TaxID=2849496 RepID=UPI001C4979A8|nr:large conductance mechanosensitive channel protein MscL [Corynebacterium sp. TAE3-ERU30]MBV7281331.1 large conductance mechanosensitive channel protein MscL [Corynebacterium sp. TAE3-ERU30]
MLKGFRDFILRGNVIDLAVAVVIGSAFTALVTAFSDNIIEPVLALFGSTDVKGLAFQLDHNKPSTVVNVGKLITAALNFLIMAGVVYFLFVAPMNEFRALQAARKGVKDDEEAPASVEEELLGEIRDLLKAQVAASADSPSAAGTAADSGTASTSTAGPDSSSAEKPSHS